MRASSELRSSVTRVSYSALANRSTVIAASSIATMRSLTTARTKYLFMAPGYFGAGVETRK